MPRLILMKQSLFRSFLRAPSIGKVNKDLYQSFEFWSDMPNVYIILV